MAENKDISDEEMLARLKKSSELRNGPVEKKEEKDEISDEEVVAAIKKRTLTEAAPALSETTGNTLSGGGQFIRPKQPETIGSGMLGSGQFAPVVGPASDFSMYAGVTDPDTRKGLAEKFKTITDPRQLKELHKTVPWYNIADNPVQLQSLFEWEWNEPTSVLDTIAAAGKAGMGMLESLPPLVAGAGRLGKEALAAAVYVGDPSAYGRGATLSEEQRQKMTAQQIQEAELSPRDRTIRASRAAGDAALEAGEGLLGAVTKFKEGKSMLYDKGRVAFAAATAEGTLGDPSIAPAISAEDENARRTAAIAPAMADARKNFATRINAKHVEHMQKEKNPAVLARTVDAVFNYPAVKRYAADLIENLMPPAEDAAPGFGGDIEAAKAARRAHAEEATNVAVQSMIDEANRLKEDPEQVGAIAMTTPLNMFGLGGKLVSNVAGVGQRIGRGLRAAGKTPEARSAMYAADSAALQAQSEAAARSREQPGFLEKPLGSLADTIDKVPVFLSKIPEPVQYAGAALFGAGAGAVTSDDPLTGALKGATTGAGIKLGGKALLAAPRLGEELLKAGRLSGAELGRFEALEKMESASPAVQRFVNWSQKAGGGKALDFIEKNANVFVQHNVSMLPMMVAMGVLEDKDAQELAQMWAEFATYGFIHGQVLGGMLGNDPIRIKMDRDAEMRQAQRVMLGLSPEARENVTNANWNRVIQQSEKRLDRAQKAYFAEMARGANTPETAKAKEFYKFAHQLHRENLVAPPEARQAFEDGIKLSLGKASNLINGVLTPNSNMNIELLTSSQIIDKMIAANPNFNGVGAPMTVEQALERNPTADGIKISKGTAEDGFTMDPAKDTVFVNIENALKKAELSGEAISTVLAHEVVGHGLFGKDDYRKRIAPLYYKMFGTEAIDENGNVRQITPAEPGMSRDDLYGKFFTKYLEGKTTEQVQDYAEAAGVWDKNANAFDKNKVVELMREETLAEAHAGRFFGVPESPLQQGLNWISSRVSSENVKSALNHLYAIAGPAVYKEWTSGKVGVTYSPEVMRAIRNVEREVKKYDGDFADAEQGEPIAAPITRKDVIKSPELLNKYFKDTGKFETTPVAVVTDADGKVVQTVDLKDNDAPEGSWGYHQDDATGNVVPNKEKGYGELHPELAQVQVPPGGRITVERKIAYDEATGKPKERKNKDTVEHIRRRVQLLREAIDNAGDASELGRFRAVKGGQGKDDEDLHYTGKMTPEQRSAIAALPESVVPASMKDLLFKYDDLMTRGDGTVLDIDYAARLNDKGNYEAFSPRIRQIVPLQLHLSKAGNFYTTAWDLSALRRKVELYKKYSKGIFEPWGGDVDAFWKEFRTKLLPKLAEKPDVEKIRQDISDAFPGIPKDQFDQKVAEEYSKKASEPAWPVLDADPETAKLKRTIYAKMLADPNPNIPGVDLIPGLPKDKFSRSEKKLDKKSDFDQIIKSYRLDAHTAAEENAATHLKYPIPYKARFMPEQEKADEQRPAFGGGLLKGLQAISAKYDPKGTGEFRAMVQPAEAQVRFMPSPVEEDYHHAEGSFPKTETSEPYKMSAIHKISDDALLFADKMGGLAVPSIAVVKAGTGIQGFGGITLVGGRDLVDPTNNPVFRGDAYTQRFPKPEYPKVKTKKAQQVIDLFKPAQSQFSQSYGDNVTDIIWDNAVNRPNPEEAVNKLKKSNAAKAAYLGKSAPEPVMRPVSQEMGILDTAPMKEWMSKNAIDNVDYDNFESRKSLGDAIIKAVQELYPPESGIVKRVGRNLVDEDGQATVSAISRLERDARNYGKMEIDSAATQKALDAALTGKESDFYQWVENTIEGMYEAPRIRVEGKWEPYNLENITRVMTSGKTAGVEKSMTQSTGLTAAQMAKRFGSLQEMRNTAEAPWGIRPESEVNEARAQVSEVLRQYRDAMTPFYKGSTWDALDTSMSALGAYYRSGRGGETKMKRTLSSLGFTNVPSNVVKQAVEAANAMSAAPVKYFEAKPQRVVQLNEFQGAIVPDNVDPSVLSVLQKNGIETRIIPSDKADDSAYVGSEIDKLKGGKQAQEQAGIRFMPSVNELPVSKFEDEYRRWRGAGWDAKSNVPSGIRFMPASLEIRQQGSKSELEYWDRALENSGIKDKPTSLEALEKFIAIHLAEQHKKGYEAIFPTPKPDKIRDYYAKIRNATPEEAADFPEEWLQLRTMPEAQFNAQFTPEKVNEITRARATQLARTANYLLKEAGASRSVGAEVGDEANYSSLYTFSEVAAILNSARKIKVDARKDQNGELVPVVQKITNSNEALPNELSAETALKIAQKMRYQIVVNENELNEVAYTSPRKEGAKEIQEIVGGEIKDPMSSDDAFVEGVFETIKAREKRRGGATGWKVYKQSANMKDAEALNADVSGTGWCTGSSVGTAYMHLKGGDFHVYFENGNPQIAIRMQGGKATEVRGTEKGTQNITTPELDDIAAGYLKSGAIPGGKDYLYDRTFRKSAASYQKTEELPNEAVDIFGNTSGDFVSERDYRNLTSYGLIDLVPQHAYADVFEPEFVNPLINLYKYPQRQGGDSFKFVDLSKVERNEFVDKLFQLNTRSDHERYRDILGLLSESTRDFKNAEYGDYSPIEMAEKAGREQFEKEIIFREKPFNINTELGSMFFFGPQENIEKFWQVELPKTSPEFLSGFISPMGIVETSSVNSANRLYTFVLTNGFKYTSKTLEQAKDKIKKAAIDARMEMASDGVYKGALIDPEITKKSLLKFLDYLDKEPDSISDIVGMFGSNYATPHPHTVVALKVGESEMPEFSNTKLSKPKGEITGIRFMPESEEDPTVVAPGFYSKAGRVLLDKMPNRASAEQIRGILDPQKGSGVKPDEMKWSGINQFIDAVQSEKGYVAKEDIKRFLKDSYAAKFETNELMDKDAWEVSFADGDFKIFNSEKEAEKAKENAEYNYVKFLKDQNFYEVVEEVFNDENGESKSGKFQIFDTTYDQPTTLIRHNYGRFELQEYYDSKEEAQAELDNLYKQIAKVESSISKTKIEETQYSTHKLPGGTNYEETVLRMPGIDYTSRHFNDVPNYVAHMRTQDFGNGRLIEELQSDLHQAARKKDPITKKPIGYKVTRDQLQARLNDLLSVPKNKQTIEQHDEINKISSDLSSRSLGMSGDEVSDAPFRNDWPIQLFKHALQKAVADGKEWIGWTGGEAQADRYSLSKHVSSIDLINDGDGKYHVTAYQNTDGSNLPVSVINKPGLSAQEVADTIGKPLAEKLIADLNSQSDPVTAYAKADGLDLNVGGEGMRGFYDTMLPKEIGKYVKQWGATVEKAPLQTKETSIIKTVWDQPNYEYTNNGWVTTETGEYLPYDSPESMALSAYIGMFQESQIPEEAKQILRSGDILGRLKDTAPIWKVQITPEMSESVAGGQARFMPDRADAEHAAAHEFKDEEKAQRLVDVTARKAGYKEVWNVGTPPQEIEGNVVRTPFMYFTDTKENADSYNWGPSNRWFIKTTPLPVTEHQDQFLDVFNPKNKGFISDTANADDLSYKNTIRQLVDSSVKEAKEAGYDGIEMPSEWENSPWKNYIVFDPSQVKSSEPFTYDDAGKLIPLSERFNTGTGDIRFMPEQELDKAAEERGYAKVVRSFSNPEYKSPIKVGDWVSHDNQSGRDYQNEYAGANWDKPELTERAYVSKGHLEDMQTGFGPGQTLKVQPGASIKSADAATYDDAGKLIPLSERFNAGTGDIRFMPNVAVVPERFTGTAEEERRGKYVEPPKFFNKFNISQYEKGGKFFDAETGEDLTDKSYENASIAVIDGKPSLVANNETETTGDGPLFKTNLFKQKAGWKWVSEDAPDTSTIVSVEGQGKHLYALQADFQNGVKMARYADKASEPRLRPTGRGELTVGEQIGTIDIRGRQHPVYDKLTIGEAPAAKPAATEGALSGVPKPFEGAQMRFNPDHKEETKKRMPMSAVEVLHKNSTVLPKPEKTRSNAEIAIQLADVAERYHGRKVTSSNITPEIENELIINGADEAEAALKASGKNAANWYSTAIQAALKVAGILHKVLTDITAAKSNPFFAKESDPLEAANFALRLPLAITSQNMTVPLNARFAEEQFNIFQQTGKFDSSKKYGGKAKSISANLNLANEMIDKLGGILELQKFVKQQFTVRDLENALSKVTGKKVGIAGRKDDIVNGAAIFGPKIGQGFLQNLMGKFDPVTIDLWMRRTWGRWTGDVVGDGVTGVRLGRMIQAFRDAGKQLPDSIKRLKTVTRSTGLTNTGKPKKPELTVTDNIENQIESDFEFRKDLERIAKETDSEFQKHYALMSAPMSPRLAKEVRSAMPANPASPTQAELESLDKAYRKVVKVQSEIDKLLDEKFSKLTIEQKKALNLDDPETAIKKDVWIGIQHAKAKRTEKLENPEKNLLKPEWAKAAKVIVSELNPVDIPSDQDRMVISRVVNNIRQELERRGYIVTNADVQAILWYPEKDLWAKLAGKKESNLKQSYDDEFIKIAEQRGVGEQARAVARDVRGY